MQADVGRFAAERRLHRGPLGHWLSRCRTGSAASARKADSVAFAISAALARARKAGSCPAAACQASLMAVHWPSQAEWKFDLYVN